jgi:glucose-6-phosphate isomerase, archaeal
MSVSLNGATGVLTGPGVVESTRRMKDLAGVFRDEAARSALNPEQILYRVQSWEPQPEGTPGAVCLATTFLEPGKVADEYFLTRGHFHANEDRPEMEVVISGQGALVLMDRERHTRIEEMRAGTVHHVPPGTAHRVANTGGDTLVFVSYWASETGHDYEAIRDHGFSARVREVDGRPALLPDP